MNETTEMKINAFGGRNKVIPQSEFERRIDPLRFQLDAGWLQYEPKTDRQCQTKELFLAARAKGRLHAFTCMAIDPSLDPVTGELVYQPGLPPAVGKSYKEWESMFENYAPDRNSRVLSKTEGVCKRLELIGRLVEWKKWSIEKAWNTVCDHSRKIGHFKDSDNAKNDFELTGSREICGFYDLGNTFKMLAEDPWEKSGKFLVTSGSYNRDSRDYPINGYYHCNGVWSGIGNALAEIALD